MKRFLLTLCALCVFSVAFADMWKDPKTNVVWTYKIIDGQASVGGGMSEPAIETTTAGEIVIPNQINGYDVSFVSDYAFYNCTGLTSVTIPEGVTSIGNYAFRDCSSLTSITIPEGVTSIGAWAFDGCSGLTSITIPEGVTSIGEGAFWGTSGLTSFSLPASVRTMPENALPPSSLTLKILGVAEGNPLYYTNPEKTLLYTKDKKRLLRVAKASCVGTVKLEEELTSIGNAIFYNCQDIQSLEIPENVKTIGNEAFRGCSGLTSITIPEGVTSIGEGAFYNCSALTSVTIPSSVTSIGGGAFEDCSELKEVYISDVAAWCMVDFHNYSSNPLYYAKNLYLNGDLVANLVIPEGVTSISEGSFVNCSSLTSITIPEGIDLIGQEVFYGCSGLTSIVIPNGVTSIGERAFAACAGLTSLTIPEGVTLVGVAAFANCSSLTSITIPEGVTSIGDYAFSGCTALTTITIPEGVTSIGSSAFSGCTGLTSVTIPDSVTLIEDKTFFECMNLTSITIPSSVASIGVSVFYHCSSLTSVIISEGVTSIGNHAFSGCSGLTSVTIPSSLNSIGRNAFYNCSGLTSITIPEGVTSIENSTFYHCSGLTSITIPDSVTSIGAWAFDGCSSNLEVFFAGAVPEGYADSYLSGKKISYPKEYASQWEAVVSEPNRLTLADVIATADVTVSAEMTTPQTMKVTYSVTSDLPTVKVRAVAFADGVRSFAKIVPVKNGENVPLGGEVASNTEHTFIWNVSEDWDTDLSKVAIEILVQEGELLPQELLTIPAVGDNKAMIITRNTITTKMAFNALLWCIAESDETLTISNGVVRANGSQIASGTSVSQNANLLNYLYGKIGYKVLAGSDLTYARNATRLDLQSSGIKWHAIKIKE